MSSNTLEISSNNFTKVQLTAHNFLGIFDKDDNFDARTSIDMSESIYPSPSSAEASIWAVPHSFVPHKLVAASFQEIFQTILVHQQIDIPHRTLSRSMLLLDHDNYHQLNRNTRYVQGLPGQESSRVI